MSNKTPPPTPRKPAPMVPAWRVDESEVLEVSAPREAPKTSLPVPAAPPRVVSAPPPPAPLRPPAAPHSAPSDAAERIRASASKGGNLKALHVLFGVTSDQFKLWMDADPGLRKAFDEGKEIEREALHRTIYEQAIYKRDINAAQFLLKSRHNYREQEPEDSRNRVNITFNIPAAAPDLKTYVEQNGKMEVVPLPRAPRVIDHE